MCLVLNQEIRTRSNVSSFSHMDLKPRKEVDASVVIELEKGVCEEDSVANNSRCLRSCLSGCGQCHWRA